MKILILDVIDFSQDHNCLENLKKVLAHRLDQPLHFLTQKLYQSELIEEEIAAADRIMISGSTRSVYDNYPWKPRLQRALQLILESGKPTYALCFGAQFVAHELGGEVIKNPNGTEFGSINIQLTEAGLQHPFLQDFHNGKKVHAAHNDRIEKLPKEAILLAYNDNSPIQAFQYKNIFATQFHTDVPSERILHLLNLRKEYYLDNGFLKDENHYEEIKNSLPLGEASYAVFERFLDLDLSDLVLSREKTSL